MYSSRRSPVSSTLSLKFFMGLLYHRGRSLSSLFSDNCGEITTVHGELESLPTGREGDGGVVVTYHGELHAPILSHSQGIASVGRGFFEELWGRKCLSLLDLGASPRPKMGKMYERTRWLQQGDQPPLSTPSSRFGPSPLPSNNKHSPL